MTTKPLYALLFPFIDALRHAPSDERAMQHLLKVVSTEREFCAAVADNEADKHAVMSDARLTAILVANTIRARGK